PPKADALETARRVIGRQVLLVQAQAEIQSQPAANRPGILRVESVIPAADLARGAQVAQIYRAPQTLAGGTVCRTTELSVVLFVRIDDRLASGNAAGRLRGVRKVIRYPHIGRVIAVDHVVGAMAERVSELQIVRAQALFEICQVLIEAV